MGCTIFVVASEGKIPKGRVWCWVRRHWLPVVINLLLSLLTCDRCAFSKKFLYILARYECWESECCWQVYISHFMFCYFSEAFLSVANTSFSPICFIERRSYKDEHLAPKAIHASIPWGVHKAVSFVLRSLLRMFGCIMIPTLLEGPRLTTRTWKTPNSCLWAEGVHIYPILLSVLRWPVYRWRSTMQDPSEIFRLRSKHNPEIK